MGCAIELGKLGVGRWQEQSQVGEASCSPRHGSVMESQGPPDVCGRRNRSLSQSMVQAAPWSKPGLIQGDEIPTDELGPGLWGVGNIHTCIKQSKKNHLYYH